MQFEAMQHAKEEAASALKRAVIEARQWAQVDSFIVDTIRTLGEAYRCVRSFKGKRALWLLRSAPNDTNLEHAPLTIDQVVEPGEKQLESLAAFKVLSPAVRGSPAVLVLIGRAYHDMALYAEAERFFERAHKADPAMTSGMDIYSLVLFHLSREVAISTLAQHLMLLDANCAAAHVAAGNAFSLQRENAMALKCFKRAVLLAPSYAYAHTLAGYEAMELGNREDARALFRSAIRCERRHWNAWSGLGQIALLENNHPYAEFHYREAVKINAQNALLFDLLGWVVELSSVDKSPALKYYDRALALNPSSVTTILKRGELLSILAGTSE